MATGTQHSLMAGAGNVNELDRLLRELEQNLESAKLSLQQLETTLNQVKVYGRNPAGAGPIFTRRSISTLSQYGLDQEIPSTSREALRCLANAFLLNETSRQIFVDLGYAPKAADRLQGANSDDEFLISRILFLLTYNTDLDFGVLIKSHQLADNINNRILHHSRNFSDAGRKMSINAGMQNMALVETLKLLFNITYYYPQETAKFTSSVESLINILLHHPIPSPPLHQPINYILNALLNLDLKASEGKTPMDREARSSPVFPYADPESVISKMTTILETAIRTQPEKELDQAAAPLCTLLRRMYELATPKIKAWMRCLLLPNEKDRDKPLGQGENISSRLLRLSCSPNLPTLRENISSLLFELSDKDANKFIQNIGYGFASGFLMSNNIEIPKNAVEANSAGNKDTNGEVDVNPITGQRLDAEERDAPQVTEMTEEEKEREAERLFVLFERLKATGVVDVKNPVQQAIDEGRFEELD